MPKFVEIGPNEAAKMIVRSTLFSAPLNVREQYASFVHPFTFNGESDYFTFGEENEESFKNISPDEHRLFEEFVNELSAIEKIDEKLLAELSHSERIEMVKKQVE